VGESLCDNFLSEIDSVCFVYFDYALEPSSSVCGIPCSRCQEDGVRDVKFSAPFT